MTFRPFIRAAALAALAASAGLALAPARVRAGDLEVSPVLVELSASARTAVVSIRNASAAPMRYQARAYSWAQGTDGAMDLLPARDLVVFPPLLELQPGESRNLRVGADAVPGPGERAWRLVVEELPRRDAEAGNAVQVLTRLGLPVFFAPARPSAGGAVELLSRDGARIRFTLRNTGNVRLRPTTVKLALLDAAGAPLLERTVDAWYVLAGGERIYEVEVPPAECGKAAEVVVTAALEAGVLEARAQGACRDP
jgi:fimbrial chaperone protein